MADNPIVITLPSASGYWGFVDDITQYGKNTTGDIQLNGYHLHLNRSIPVFDFLIPADPRTLLSATVTITQIGDSPYETAIPTFLRILSMPFSLIYTGPAGLGDVLIADFLYMIDESDNCGSLLCDKPQVHNISVGDAGLTALRSKLSGSGGYWTGALVYEEDATYVLFSRDAGMTLMLTFGIPVPIAGKATNVTTTGFTANWVSGE